MPIIVLVCIIIAEMVLMEFTIGFTTHEPIISLSIVTTIVAISWIIGIRVLNLEIYYEIERVIRTIMPKR